jgi:hypothetical protein
LSPGEHWLGLSGTAPGTYISYVTRRLLMATAKKTSPKFVWVFENVWHDRHGDEGTNVKVFATKKKADAYFANDIEYYLTNYDAVVDGKVDTNTVDSLNTNTVSIDCEDDKAPTLAEVQKAAADCGWLDINVDSSGTNSSWSVSKEEVL